MRGKYSPTVSRAYQVDQDWHRKYTAKYILGDQTYDPDDFDAYGYNCDDVDRAGNTEYAYYGNDCPPEYNDDYNDAYDLAEDNWDFDGEKPVLREKV